MDEVQAEAIAGALGGITWQSGGDIWLVLLRRSDGRLVVVSDDAVCEYDGEDAFDGGCAAQTIRLR